MSKCRVTKSSVGVSQSPYRRDGALRHLLTTADAAKELQLSVWRVRQLAEQGDLPFDLTRSGQFIFKLKDVRGCRDQRADRDARPRDERLRLVRCQMLKAPLEPRQLDLLGRRMAHLVRDRGERALSDRRTKRADFGVECRESDRSDSVNRKRAQG